MVEVLRTLLKVGALGFLGVLAYKLVDKRVSNPPAQVVHMDSAEVEAIRNELAICRQSIDDARESRLALSGKLQSFANERSEHLVSEYGLVRLQATRKSGPGRITFRRRYKQPPLVIGTQNILKTDERIRWHCLVQVQKITETDAFVTARIAPLDGKAPETYSYDFAYIVIGEPAD